MPTLGELKSAHRKRWRWWLGAILSVLAVVGLIAGLPGLRKLATWVGSLMMIVGLLLTHTIRWDDHGPGATKRSLIIPGLFVAGFVLAKLGSDW
jgi:hypothetical protein